MVIIIAVFKESDLLERDFIIYLIATDQKGKIYAIYERYMLLYSVKDLKVST